MLTLVVAVAAFYAVCLSLLGLTSPSLLINFLSHWRSRTGLWMSAVIRLLFGLALWGAAPMSRAPEALQALAALSVLGAVAIPSIGFERAEMLMTWWERQAASAIRIWSAVFAVVGMFIFWAVIA